MGDSGQNRSSGTRRWIVLIDKTLRGPLTYEEIEALLSQGEMRRNDLACLIPPPEDKSSENHSTQWKFLWQFPDFDRRSGESSSKASPPPVERRALEEPPEKKIPVLLPSDIASLRPEDLVIHATQRSVPKIGQFDEVSERRAAPATYPPANSLRRWVPAALASVAVIFVLISLEPKLSQTKDSLLNSLLPKRTVSSVGRGNDSPQGRTLRESDSKSSAENSKPEMILPTERPLEPYRPSLPYMSQRMAPAAPSNPPLKETPRSRGGVIPYGEYSEGDEGRDDNRSEPNLEPPSDDQLANSGEENPAPAKHQKAQKAETAEEATQDGSQEEGGPLRDAASDSSLDSASPDEMTAPQDAPPEDNAAQAPSEDRNAP